MTAPDQIGSVTPVRRRPYGLLLVAAPVLLALWLIILPIISAIISTVWVATPAGKTFSIETYPSNL